MKKWLRNNFIGLAMAFSNVEKNVSNNLKNGLGSTVNQVQDVNQGRMSQSLLKGEITQAVKELRWRTYKVITETDKIELGAGGRVVRKNVKTSLKKIRVDEHDDYKLEISIDNKDMTSSVLESFVSIEQQATYNSLEKLKPIIVNRECKPKFEIEKYSDKINIRDIDGEEKLIEFYVSMYPNEYDRRTRLFISEIKKAINNPRSVDFLEINTLWFISTGFKGVYDNLEFEYIIDSFDKIVEFEGNYVIKFKSHVITDGVNVLETYRLDELDKKYENKERK